MTMTERIAKFFDFIFKKDKRKNTTYSGIPLHYQAASTTQAGKLYELSLVRACIHSFATECSKASPVLSKENRMIEYMVSKEPNEFMTASQFYYRLATIYEIENNAFIIPIEERGKIVGLFPISPLSTEFVEYQGKLFVRYTFLDGDIRSIEYSKVGHLRKMQYQNNLVGATNDAFNSTAQLLGAIEKGGLEAIENGSKIRFMAQLNTTIDSEEDMRDQQSKISELNLKNNQTGIFMYDPRFQKMEQMKSDAKLVDATQKEAIDKTAFSYWGTSESILQNTYTEDVWNAYYESKIEPFFIQLGEVLTKLVFSREERINGQNIMLASDRLQYASNKTKLNVAIQLFDRGVLTTNGVLNILNMPPIPDGDQRYIRAEYIHPSDEKVETDGEGVKGDGTEDGSPND